MEEKYWMQMLAGESEKHQLEQMMAYNSHTARYGLVLSREEAKQLLEERKEDLKEQHRVEFGEGILPKLMEAFCDSAYIDQRSYAETLSRLQGIFYFYKNESMDWVTDDELIDYMREAFDGRCQGSLEYLEDTCLEEYARMVRHRMSFWRTLKNAGKLGKPMKEL